MAHATWQMLQAYVLYCPLFMTLDLVAMTNLARNKRPGMNGLTLGEEVRMFASSCLGWIQKL